MYMLHCLTASQPGPLFKQLYVLYLSTIGPDDYVNV
jgi:hypothetical protein